MDKWKFFYLLVLFVAVSISAQAGVAEAKQSYSEANAAFKAKNYGSAIELYQKVEQEEPAYGKYVQGQIAYCYYFLKDEGKALFYFEEHLKNKPGDARAQKYADSLKNKGVLPDNGGSGKNMAGEKIRSNVIFTNPGFMAAGILNLGYQRAINDHQSFVLNGALVSLSASGGKYKVTGGSAGYRFSTKRLGGWFFAPKVGYWTASFKVDTLDVFTLQAITAEATGSLIQIGGEGGYQWIWGSGFMLNLGVGANYLSGTMKDVTVAGVTPLEVPSTSASATGVIPSGFLNLGYGF